MKYILLCMLLSSSVLLFGFDIEAVDMTEEGKKKAALPYTIAKDGKKIYKDIGKVVQPMKNQTIHPMKNQTVELMDVKIIYSEDSNETHVPSTIAKKKTKTTPKEENLTSVFADINTDKEHKIESINNENKQIRLNNETKKSTPVDLEK